MRLTEHRGVSGIIAGVILFALLFSVGTSYFLLEITGNSNYDAALTTRQQSQQQNLQESLTITMQDSGGYLAAFVVNTGGVVSNITTIIVETIGSGVSEYGASFTQNTSPALPVVIAPETTSTIKIPITLTSATYDVYIITEAGNTFSSSYPPAASNLVPAALTSGAIGDLYLTFHTFTYYHVVTCGSSSGYCLGTSGSGFITPSGAGNIAFAVSITDLNSEKDDIVLDQFTLIYQNSFYGANHQNFIAWYIVSNSSNDILSAYNPIILQYDVPVTVVFAASTCVSSSAGPNDCSGNAFSPTSTPSSAYTISANFIISHGWELPPPVTVSSLSYSTSNYGQDSPFVSTLYT
jgi:hypothetical protein